MINVVHAFTGVDAQYMAEKKVWGKNNINVVGSMEIDVDAIISCALIHENEKFHKHMEKEWNNEDYDNAREWLRKRNIGFDFKANRSKLDRMKKDKLKQLYVASVCIKNYGDISLSNKVKLKDEIDLFTYSFPCFVAGTKVLTYDGFKNIEDITDNDYVLTHKNRYKKVVKPMVNLANHIYKISTMCSDDLYATEEHPFYVRKRYKKWNNDKRCYDREFENPMWIKTKDLTRDFYVGVAINKESKLPNWNGVTFKWKDGRKDRVSNILKTKMNDKDFWWIIGRYIGDGWIRHQGGIIICCDKPETNEITNKLDVLHFNYNIVSERAINKIHIPLKELGKYVEQFGRGAKNKRLTQDIFNLPISLLKGFLDGYMSADGCFTQGLNKASSISNELIYGIGQCVAKIYNRPFSIYKTNRSNKCVIEGRVVNQQDSYTITWKNTTNKQDKAFYEDGYIWCPINDVKKQHYDGFVYNMEVEDDNSYVVQNIIVHNCTDISVAGKQEGLSKGSGTRSGLLWECEQFIVNNKPKVLVMENVKNLVGSKFINEFNSWLGVLGELGYKSYWKVLNAKEYGVAQNRERVFCVSIRNDIDCEYIFNTPTYQICCIKDILESNVDKKYYLSDSIQNRFVFKPIGDNIVGTTDPNKSIGQRDLVYNPNKIMGCLVATDYKQPKQILEVINPLKDRTTYGWHFEQQVYGAEGIARTVKAGGGSGNIPKIVCDTSNLKIRKLTPRECWRLMGFSDEDFDKVKDYISDTQLYKQAGNSIVVNCLEAIFNNLKGIIG